MISVSWVKGRPFSFTAHLISGNDAEEEHAGEGGDEDLAVRAGVEEDERTAAGKLSRKILTGRRPSGMETGEEKDELSVLF